MQTARGKSSVVEGSSDPLTTARLLAVLLGRPMTAPDLRRWVRDNDAADVVDELLAAGAVCRTGRGGLALDCRRQGAALSALAHDLRL